VVNDRSGQCAAEASRRVGSRRAQRAVGRRVVDGDRVPAGGSVFTKTWCADWTCRDFALAPGWVDAWLIPGTKAAEPGHRLI
jgi:hypothetical protein